MNILILSALESELGRLITELKPAVFFKTGKYIIYDIKVQGRHYYFGLTGVGAKNVRGFFELYFRLNIHAGLVVSTGYAGALNPALAVGDIIRARYLLKNRQGKAMKKEELVILPETGFKPQVKFKDLTLLGVDRIISRDEKRELKKFYHRVDCLDMESWEIARICRENKIDVAIIRAISDTYDFKFPALEFARDSFGYINKKKFLFHLAKSPLDAVRYAAMRKNLRLAAIMLCKTLSETIAA